MSDILCTLYYGASKSSWNVELKDILILVPKIVKSMHNFSIMCIFHQLFEDFLCISAFHYYSENTWDNSERERKRKREEEEERRGEKREEERERRWAPGRLYN